MAVLNVAVLVSGRGSNLQALLDRAASRAGFRVAVVVSDQPDAPALERAASAGVPVAVVAPAPGEGRAAFDTRLGAALARRGVELVCLAGFMRILGPAFVERWRGPSGQHPPVAAAGVSRARYARACAPRRRHPPRVHGALGPPGGGCGPDHRAGGRAGAADR